MSSLASIGTAPGPSAHVLLVDDALDNRELYAIFLQQSGFQVMEAAEGREALECVARGPAPDIMVTDILLPDMDGLDLCRRVRAQPGLQNTPVIAITALPMSDREVARAREAGSAILLHKPCLPETLLLEIRALLAQGQALRAKSEQVRYRAHALTQHSRILQERSWALQLDAQRLLERKLHETLVRRIRNEYQEMPGLALTVEQARRLWGLDRPVCETVLQELMRERFLTQMRDGSYIRNDRP